MNNTPIQLQMFVCLVFFLGGGVIFGFVLFFVIGLTSEGPRCLDPRPDWKICGLIVGVFDRSSVQYDVIILLI